MYIALVTGGTGFLGAHLICELLSNDFEVKALKRPESLLYEFNKISALYFGHDNDKLINKLTWVEGDILDYFSIERNIDNNTFVFHCAALVSFNKKDKYKLFETNIKGTANVADACLYKKARKLIYVSSTAAVGKVEEPFLTDENTLWDEKDNPSNYSISKYYAELEVWRIIEEGANAVIVNPPLIIGEGNWEKNTGIFFSNANKNFPFYTEGSNAFVYVRDVAKAMRLLALSDISAQRYLLIGENISFRKFMDMISISLNKKKPYIKINSVTSSIAWRVAAILFFFGLTKEFITKESAQSSLKKVKYSSEKIKSAIQFEFTPLQIAIEKISEVFKKEN